MTNALDTLAEFAFGDVMFPGSEVQTEGGNDGVEHTAYLRRGADIEPTGQRAYRGTISIPCINTPSLVARYGTLFPDLRNALISLWQDVPIGTFVHPTFGTFPAFFHAWTEHLTPDLRNGSTLQVQWTEHNGAASQATGNAASNPANTPSSVQRQASACDVTGAVYTGLVPMASSYAGALTTLETAVAYTAVQAAFRVMLSAVAGNLALRSMQFASSHAMVVQLLTLQAATLDLRSRYMPTIATQRTFRVPASMALWQVAQLVYGDASQTGLLKAANAIPDPSIVPSGTVLIVLPAP